MFAFGLLVLVLPSPAGSPRQEGVPDAGCSRACPVPPRASRRAVHAAPRVPFFASGYLLAVGFLILYFAYVGQAWNIMMGFAGQLSLGHSLYVGLGATPRPRCTCISA